MIVLVVVAFVSVRIDPGRLSPPWRALHSPQNCPYTLTDVPAPLRSCGHPASRRLQPCSPPYLPRLVQNRPTFYRYTSIHPSSTISLLQSTLQSSLLPLPSPLPLSLHDRHINLDIVHLHHLLPIQPQKLQTPRRDPFQPLLPQIPPGPFPRFHPNFFFL